MSVIMLVQLHFRLHWDPSINHLRHHELEYFLHPEADMIEGLSVGDVKDEHDAHGALVETLGDDSELLLASSVSNLNLYEFVLDLNDFAAELNSDGAHRATLKHVFNVSVHHRGLPYLRVSQNH